MFDGDIAWFLAERAPRGGWRIVRRIHAGDESDTEPAATTAEPVLTPNDP